jgi:hypothetical protein
MTSRSIRRRFATTIALGGLLAALALPGSVAAAAPDVTYGTANVDGNAGEWDLNADFFASLHAGSNVAFPARADSYARYDCASSTLYVYVKARTGETIKTDEPGDHYIRIDGAGKLVSDLSGDDGTAPDFHFVGQSGNTASGWEASGILPPGTYDIRIFTKVNADDTDGYDAILRDTQIGTDCAAGSGPTHTIGFWKNWTSCDGKGGQSPITDAVLASFPGGGVSIGDLFVNTCPEAIAILDKSTLGGTKMANDAAYGLAAQLLAARLNVQADAVTCGTVNTAIAGGQALLDAIGFDGTGTYLKSSSADRTAALAFAATLDSYNNGNVC